ncbi:MAG: hypothetical protein KKI02_08575, partial [Planctomycetes bacterium]|nr:hypothetical protein [Planctomycetota bacterium]
KETPNTSQWDWSERSGYGMRLHFWLGEYDEAEQMRADRYGPDSGYDRKQEYDADDSLCEAIIAASGGNLIEAEQALRTGVEFAREHPEYLLRLHAAYQLIRRAPPAELLPENTCGECKLSPGWTPEWLAALTGYARGKDDWSAVEEAARADIQRRDDKRLRLAGAWYFRGVRELASRQREQAMASFAKACDQYDNENYCFRAKFLLIKLQTDPRWPGWLAEDQGAGP